MRVLLYITTPSDQVKFSSSYKKHSIVSTTPRRKTFNNNILKILKLLADYITIISKLPKIFFVLEIPKL